MADDIQDVVRCKRFEVVDDNGEKRAEIGMSGVRLNLIMYAPSGEPRIRIEVDNLGAANISLCHGPKGGHSMPIASVNPAGYIHTNEYKQFPPPDGK
jgi:hypothetical protein